MRAADHAAYGAAQARREAGFRLRTALDVLTGPGGRPPLARPTVRDTALEVRASASACRRAYSSASPTSPADSAVAFPSAMSPSAV